MTSEGHGTRAPPSHASIHEFIVCGAQIYNTDPDERVDLFADERFGSFFADVRRHVGNDLAHVLSNDGARINHLHTHAREALSTLIALPMLIDFGRHSIKKLMRGLRRLSRSCVANAFSGGVT